MKEKLKQIHERNKAKKEERRKLREEESKCGPTRVDQIRLAVRQEYERQLQIHKDSIRHRYDCGEKGVVLPGE